MIEKCQILILSTDYHILVYLLNSGELEKCNFLIHDLIWLHISWLPLDIKSLFSFFNECTQIINSPLCCVLDARNKLSKFV